MKKTLSILLLSVLAGFCSCNRMSVEEVQESIIYGVKDQIPYIVQQIYFVEDISVDSMRIVVDKEPMSGYLYTTWETRNGTFPVIVNVTDIRRSKDHKGYIEWMADWKSAALACIWNSAY